MQTAITQRLSLNPGKLQRVFRITLGVVVVFPWSLLLFVASSASGLWGLF